MAASKSTHPHSRFPGFHINASEVITDHCTPNPTRFDTYPFSSRGSPAAPLLERQPHSAASERQGRGVFLAARVPQRREYSPRKDSIYISSDLVCRWGHISVQTASNRPPFKSVRHMWSAKCGGCDSSFWRWLGSPWCVFSFGVFPLVKSRCTRSKWGCTLASCGKRIGTFGFSVCGSRLHLWKCLLDCAASMAVSEVLVLSKYIVVYTCISAIRTLTNVIFKEFITREGT